MNSQIPHVLQPHSQAETRAGGSSFYLAMRILDRARREAMFEVYSFCRAVDDIADSEAPHADRLAGLTEWRLMIDLLYRGSAPPNLVALADAVKHYGLRREDFDAVIDGVEMDAREDIQAPSLAQLEHYVDGVACAVGRLCVRIFGMEEAEGRALARHLGRALQFTNILRDIDEDAEHGRLYLPREALQRAQIEDWRPQAVAADPRLGVACDVIVALAREDFDRADKIMAGARRSTVRAPKIMCDVYRRMLTGMVARGWSPPRHRVRVNKTHLVWIALRHAIV